MIDCFLEANTKNMSLSIAGGDKKKITELREKFKTKTDKKIYFLGHIDKNKFNYLSSLDYFIMLSENENFGNVYLEALCVGTPIITSKFTPFNNIEKFNSGYTLNLDKKQIINFLERLNKSQKKKLKVSKKFISNFDQKKIISKFYSFYKNVYFGKKII